jgi:hypothetical protein
MSNWKICGQSLHTAHSWLTRDNKKDLPVFSKARINSVLANNRDCLDSGKRNYKKINPLDRSSAHNFVPTFDTKVTVQDQSLFKSGEVVIKFLLTKYARRFLHS